MRNKSIIRRKKLEKKERNSNEKNAAKFQNNLYITISFYLLNHLRHKTQEIKNSL